MAGNQGAAMFEFRTNIDSVASDIAGAMARINATLSQPLQHAELAANTAGLGQMGSRLETEVQSSVRRMQELVRSGITPENFKDEFRNFVKNDLRSIPQVMANELGLVAPSVAASSPVRELARDAGKSYVQTLRDTIRAERPDLADAIKNVRFPTEMQGLYREPAAFGNETSIRSKLANQVRAEAIIKRDPVLGPNALSEAAEQGFTPQYMRDLQARATAPNAKNEPTYVGTDAAKRLAEINRQEVEHQITANNSAKAMDKEAQAAKELATALALVKAEELGIATKAGGRTLIPSPSTGESQYETYRTTPHGAVLEQNPMRISAAEKAVDEAEAAVAARQAELANAEAIVAAQANQVTKTVGTQHKVGGTHYRRTNAGAAEVTHPLDIARAEAALDEAAETLARKRQELADAVRLAGTDKSHGVRSVGIGDHYRDTSEGVTPVTNPVQVADADKHLRAMNEEMANSQRLIQNWGSVVPVGQYRVLGQEVYKLSTYGAARVTEDAKILEALQGQDAYLKKQEATRERLAKANVKSALKTQADGAGFAGGFANRFNRGEGSLINSIGGQVAAAASFSLGYGALFAAQGAIRDLVAEYSDYQDSLTDLQVATRDSDVVTGEWVDQLGDLARVTGENVGAALDTAARGVRAFSDPLRATKEELQSIGLAANAAANELALVANKSLTDATGDTIAVGTAYNMAPDQLSQIVDAVANAKRALGGDPKEISQGLASISSSAQAAGYDLNQAASLISLVQARTDESGQAAATRLTRIFQTVSGTTGKKLGAELGVNTNQSAREQLEAYSRIYTNPDTSKAVKDRITSSIGGTANLRELLPVLQEGARLQGAYAAAAENAGQGNAEFARKSNNIPGTLKKIRGDLRAIEVDLARTDLFAPFGLAIKTLEPVLHLLDRILKVIDALPAPIRHVTAGLVDMAIAAKAIAVVQSVQGERAAAVAAAQGGQSLIAGGAAGLAGTAGGLGGGAAGRVGMMGGLKSMGKFLLNPYTIGATALIGGAVLTEKYFEGVDQRKSFLNKYGDTSAALSRGDGSATSLRAAADDLRSAAGQIRQSDSNFVSKGTQKELVSSLKEQGKELRTIATRVAAEQSRNAGHQDLSTFGEGGVVTTVSELASGLAALDDAGVTATAQMRILADVLNNTATPQRGQVYSPEQFAANLSTEALGGLKDALPEKVTRMATQSVAGYQSLQPTQVDAREALPDLRDANHLKDINKAVADAATQMGLRQGDVLTDAQKETLAHAAVASFNLDSLGKDAKEVRRRLFDSLMRELRGQAPQTGELITDTIGTVMSQLMAPLQGGSKKLLNGKGALTRGQIMSLLHPSDGEPDLAALQQASIAAIPASDDGTKLIKALKTNRDVLQSLKTRAAMTGADVGQLNLLLDNTEDQLIEAQVTRMEALRRAAQNKAHGKKEIRAIGQASLEKEIAAAGNNTKRLIAIMEMADEQALAIVHAHLEEAARVANASQAAELAAAGLHTGGNPTIAGNTKVPKTPAQRLLDSYNKADAGANVPSKDGTMLTGSDAANYDGSTASDTEKLSAAQRKALLRQARRNPDDTVGAARDTLAVAQANLDAEKKNTSQWYSALQAVTQAEGALGDALAQQSTAAVHLAAARAGGGQLATAKAALDSARIHLSTQTPGTPGYDDALAEVINGHKGMRDAHAQDIASAADARAAGAGGGQMAQAKAALTGAKAHLDAQTKGTSEWNDALAQYYQAQQGMRDAIASGASATANLRAARAGGGQMAQARAALTTAAANLNAQVRGTAEWKNALAQYLQAQQGMRDAAASRTSAIAQAAAARSNDPIAGARAQIVGARAQMNAATRGTAEWFQALASFYQGQWALKDAIVQYGNSIDQLRGDSTDPVEQARDALRAANRRLRADANAGKAVRAQDRVAQDQARNQLQGAKFDQRLRDMQTAEDLGRISFRKYMSYLDHEHDRLTRIKHRTRQQQDELDTVDKAMKDAVTSMDGQFNLGDINTHGMVYQARRFQAEMRHNAAAAQMSNTTQVTQTVTIDINGADTAKVRKIIEEVVGGPTRTRTTQARRR